MKKIKKISILLSILTVISCGTLTSEQTNTIINTLTKSSSPTPSLKPIDETQKEVNIGFKFEATIKDQKTGDPIIDAEIDFNNQTTKSNSNGHFEFNNIPPGEYKLQIFKKNKYNDIVDVIISDSSKNVNYFLGINNTPKIQPTLNPISNSSIKPIALNTPNINPVTLPTTTPTILPTLVPITPMPTSIPTPTFMPTAIPTQVSTPIPTPMPTQISTSIGNNYDPKIDLVNHVEPTIDIPNRLEPNNTELRFRLYDNVKQLSRNTIYWETGLVKFDYVIYSNISRYQSIEPIKGSIVTSGSVTFNNWKESQSLTFNDLKSYGSYFIIKTTAYLPNGKTITTELNTLI